MSNVDVKIVNESLNALPEYANAGDSGMDVRANIQDCNEKFMFDSEIVYCTQEDTPDENGIKTIDVLPLVDCIVIRPGGRALIDTGIRVAIPEGYEIQVRPRSGLALKSGITVLNTPGTIDSGYRNTIGVILMNHSQNYFTVRDGDRIAQLVLVKVEKINWELVDSLDETERGEGGFGHTGVA